jgi:hypothetical protein
LAMKECVSCGSIIKSGVMCDACEVMLLQSSQVTKEHPENIYFNQQKTKYFNKLCPACGVWLNVKKLKMVYRNSIFRHNSATNFLICPNCQAQLISKYHSRVNVLIALCSLSMIAGFFRSDEKPYTLLVSLIITVVALSYAAIYYLRESRDERSLIIRTLDSSHS